MRTVRIEDGLWNAAQTKAIADGDSISAVIRDALRQYIEDNEAGKEG